MSGKVSTIQDDSEINPEIHLLLRVFTGILSAILGFNFSRTAFFREYPLFGFSLVGELMAMVIAGAIGYFSVPSFIISVKRWFETLVSSIVSDIVSKFWEEQSVRIQQARREKQQKKSDEEKSQFTKNLQGAILVDTSVLVDGRILDIVKTGFLDRTFVIPQNVVEELHQISDNADKIKRQRGRRGLDIMKKLKKDVKVISPHIRGKKKGVDKTLVSFAKEHGLQLMTLDFNLNKVADVLGIKVLNINDLVNALKTVLLPGEELQIELIQEGKEKNQGVGYLNDGTMVVVADSRDLVGKTVKVCVKKVIQSAAGKMVFCELDK